MERASRVCTTCRTRKKACDKALPQCGYCSKRNLVCKYRTDESPSSATSAIRSDGSSASFSFESLSFDVSGPRELSERLDIEVFRVLQSAQLSLQDLNTRYFEGLHRWLPIISPTLLSDITVDDGPPSADASVLLLTMCLIVLLPHVKGTPVNSLYVTVKMAFSRVQIMMTASIRLAQAGLLLVAYEHARGCYDAASISMGTVTSMAFAIGLNEDSETFDGLPARGTSSRSMAAERRNVWWGVLILERIIISEPGNTIRRPITELPPLNTHWPSDFGIEEQRRASTKASVTDMRTAYPSCFERLAQATFFLDRVLRNIAHTAAETRLLEIPDLDNELRSFLVLLLDDCRARKATSYCHSAIAMTVRALFLLHQSTVSIRPCSLMPDIEAQLRQRSQAALKTAARLTADAALDHVQTLMDVGTIPLCCMYNIRMAKRYLESCGDNAGDKDSPSGLEALMTLERTLMIRVSEDAEDPSERQGL